MDITGTLHKLRNAEIWMDKLLEGVRLGDFEISEMNEHIDYVIANLQVVKTNLNEDEKKGEKDE